MNNKILIAFGIIILFAGIFTVFITVVNAKGLNLFGSKQPNMLVTLKNDVDINKSKEVISKIPYVKIIKIQDRNEEWSRMVNKMDLPKMDNPFKNEFTVKINKKANTEEVFNQLKEINFVEKIEYISD